MCPKVLTFLLVASIQIYTETYGDDCTAMSVLKDGWRNTPRNWVGPDPCGGKWEGITCHGSSVIVMTLAGVGLTGQLSGDISYLSELVALDLSNNTGLEGSLPPSIVNLKKLKQLKLAGCGFTGPIPELIGSLEMLEYVELGSNGFTGTIPPSIGSLSKLIVLDLFNNQLHGSIPVSSGTTSGLDMLVKAQHFRLGKNQFSGKIPDELFRPDMALIHVLLHDNNLTGSIPSTLGLVKSLEEVSFEGNSLTGTVPSNLNNLTRVTKLILSNNNLTGPVPNLTGMVLLNYLDLSNNSFDASELPSSFSNLQVLTTLVMENTGLEGLIPPTLFDIPTLQTLILRNNKLSGTLDLTTSSSSQLKVIDMQNNNISFYLEAPERMNKVKVILVGNPVCEHAKATANYCTLELGHQITSSQFRTRSVIGAVAGGATFLVLLLLAGVYAYRQKKRRERASEQENHFAYLDLKNSDSAPQLKGARCFSFDEITKCANNFSEANHIGTGGYGMASLSLFSSPALVVSFA